jgi:hypothetical protein
MKINSRRIPRLTLSLGLLSLALMSVSASNGDPITKIANYRQWSKVTQEISETFQISTIDLSNLSAIGG